jgi:hypothetical protein
MTAQRYGAYSPFFILVTSGSFLNFVPESRLKGTESFPSSFYLYGPNKFDQDAGE